MIKFSNNNISEYILKNSNGISVKILSYAGIIKEINIPDRNNKFENIVLSYKNNEQYLNDDFFIGALIGRYANRISDGRFKLNENIIQLDQNEKNNHLHGGNNGFHKNNWQLEEYDELDQKFVKLKFYSKDLDGGYPGNLKTTVKYTLTEKNKLSIEFYAKSDKDTIYNPTSHSYFNLCPSNNSILKHKIKINAEKYIALNSQCLPIGKLENLKNTPFDFRSEKKIGKEIESNNKQIKIGNGYDHCFVLNRNNPHAEISDEVTGRKVIITTDQPGIQLYTGNHLKGTFMKNEGVCLETQHFPDSPNNINFPTTLLKAKKEYYTKTSYSFSLI